MSDGKLVLVTGQSRSGKSRWTAQEVKSELHLLVWDSMGEWNAVYRCRNILGPLHFHRIATSSPKGRYSFAVPVTAKNFDLFCRFAWIWLRVLNGRKLSGAIVVEELADVTPPGKAPDAWGEIIRKSLRFGTRIFAVTQSTAESDKTSVRNATVLHCHALARDTDRRDMARELDVDQSMIDNLDFARFEWIERDRHTRELRRGGKGQSSRKIAQSARS